MGCIITFKDKTSRVQIGDAILGLVYLCGHILNKNQDTSDDCCKSACLMIMRDLKKISEVQYMELDHYFHEEESIAVIMKAINEIRPQLNQIEYLSLEYIKKHVPLDVGVDYISAQNTSYVVASLNTIQDLLAK